MMPRALLEIAGVKRIVGCGSALVKNNLFSEAISDIYSLPLVIQSNMNSSDAAFGAALAVIRYGNL